MREEQQAGEVEAPKRRALPADLARRMGMSTSEAKRTAARANGRLGGWPKGRPLSEETRRKISATKTLKMLNRLLGRPANQDTPPA